MQLQIGDLVYDNRYLGMIVAIKAEYTNSVFYEVEWFAAGYTQIVGTDHYSKNRTEGFRNTYLKARKRDDFKTW